MPLFLVTYDLLKRKDHPQLWAAFDHLGAHRAAFSAYFVEAAMTAEQLKNHLGDFIDYDDRLVVAEVSKRPALRNALVGTSSWLGARSSAATENLVAALMGENPFRGSAGILGGEFERSARRSPLESLFTRR